MRGMNAQTQIYVSYALTAIVMGVILWLRFRSMSKVRPLKLERLWVLPAIYALIAGYMFFHFPPEPRGWLYAAIALLAGLALGWQRGKLMQIVVDPATRTLTQKASPAAMLVIVCLIFARMGSRLFMGTEISDGQGLHGSTLLITDSLIAMALGFLTAQRVEMYTRSKRLLAADFRQN
jgi:predicted permease